MSTPDRETIVEFDRAVDRAMDRVRSPAVDGIVYRLSSAADHSLLWHVCGRGHRDRTRRRRRVRGSLHGRDGPRVVAHQRRGEDRVPAGATGARTKTSRSATDCTARSRARSLPGTRRPRSARPGCSAAGPVGTRSPLRWRAHASTCACTTHRTSPPARPSAWCSGARSAGSSASAPRVGPAASRISAPIQGMMVPTPRLASNRLFRPTFRFAGHLPDHLEVP